MTSHIKPKQCGSVEKLDVNKLTYEEKLDSLSKAIKNGYGADAIFYEAESQLGDLITEEDRLLFRNMILTQFHEFLNTKQMKDKKDQILNKAIEFLHSEDQL